MAAWVQYPHKNSSQRGLAMVLALACAIILSPLYVHRYRRESWYEERWSYGTFVHLPVMIVTGLIVAIKTTSSSSTQRKEADFSHRDTNAGLVFRIGSSSLGLAGILIMLLFVISWQASVKHFFWR